MAFLRLIIEATSSSTCGVFEEGDRMVVDYPRVITEETDTVCVQAIHSLSPHLLALSRGVAFATLGLDFDSRGGIVRCGCHLGEAGFIISREATRAVVPEDFPEMEEAEDLDAAILDKVSVFSLLPREAKRSITKFLRPMLIAPGAVILRQGEVGKTLYIVASGEVEVVSEDPSGREKVLAVLTDGECFGDMSLITGEPISATIRTRTEAMLLGITKPDFDRILMENPSLHLYFNRLLVHRLKEANLRVTEILEKGLTGDLSTFGVAELAQTLHLNRRTGLLTLAKGKTEAHVFFDGGMVREAKVGRDRGVEAFYTLLGWSRGSFKFDPNETPPEDASIEADTMSLLFEGIKRLDEQSH
jgi:uncharacterized repeat protein (TIGR04076 family)